MGFIDKYLGRFVNKTTPPEAEVTKKRAKRAESNITKISMQRIKQDTLTWRDALVEAENVYFPYRVKMQQLYLDTILNGHVAACLDRRRDLTLLREYFIHNADGSVNDEATELIKEPWFNEFMSITMDALFFGYSLISLGDIVNSKFTTIEPVKRWNISPDRLVVSTVPYSPDGIEFLDPKWSTWNVYVPTPNPTATSICGMGMLYPVALYEIFLRNVLGYNGDFVELFAQPYRIGKTDKTEIEERDAFEELLATMGSTGYALMDTDGDSIEFLESSLGADGYKAYADLEERLEKKISKLILGHSDAMDSIPGQLGNTKGDENPVYLAMMDKKSKDGNFVSHIVNSELIPRLQKFGFPFPVDCYFSFKNDSEANKLTLFLSEIAQTMQKGGLQMDPLWFEEQTGIKVVIPTVSPNITPDKPEQP